MEIEKKKKRNAAGFISSKWVVSFVFQNGWIETKQVSSIETEYE